MYYKQDFVQLVIISLLCSHLCALSIVCISTKWTFCEWKDIFNSCTFRFFRSMESHIIINHIIKQSQQKAFSKHLQVPSMSVLVTKMRKQINHRFNSVSIKCSTVTCKLVLVLTSSLTTATLTVIEFNTKLCNEAYENNWFNYFRV